MTTVEPRTEIERLRSVATALEREVAQVIVGQQTVLRGVTIALLAGGHVLLEGLPGLGKTLLVRTVAGALQLQYSRIQFTPDLMPADIMGTNVLLETAQGGGLARTFQFQPGPIFANIVLADEINRATPKTQSALLEAMQEQAVTVGTVRHPLPQPFFVLATQNPIELEGAGHGADQQRLAQARQAFQQHVPAGQQGDGHAAQHRLLADDDLGHLTFQRRGD